MYTPKYFSLSEFLYSYTAKVNSIENLPTFEQVENLNRLCKLVLDDARMKLGSPIRVNSGFRNVELNKRVGGALNSQHCKGLAADISCKNMGLLFDILTTNPNIDQLLNEYKGKNHWIHVSIAPKGKQPRKYIQNLFYADK